MKSDKCAFCSRVETTVEHRFYCVGAHIEFGTSFLLLCLDY